MLSQLPPRPSKETQPIRVVILERDRMSSQLLAESLGRDSRFQVVGVPSTDELVSVATLRQPDVAVICADLVPGAKKGLQVARVLSVRLADIRVVLLLDILTRESVLASFRSGATGVFCRTEPMSEFCACIEQVSRGEIWARGGAAKYLLEAIRSGPSCGAIEGDISMLSKREIEVVECAVQGQTNKQIAGQLHLSAHTVKNYLFRVFEKLGVSNRTELLFWLSTHTKDSFPAPAALSAEGRTNSFQEYLRAAREGSVPAQFIVGLAYCEGCGIEKNESSAYYWLRMVEENSTELRDSICALIQKASSRMTAQEIETLEKRLMAQKEETHVGKKVANLIKTDAPGEHLVRTRACKPA
jgi:two-component system, NarL family, nitrate/nitrite response regulator NarL